MIHPPHHLPAWLGLAGSLAAAVLASIYIAAAKFSARRFGKWPHRRTASWIAGIACLAAAAASPLMERAHHDFAAHMLVHLLLGMLAPLLMALAAPVTLLFRTIDPKMARRVSRLLRSPLSKALARPETAALLNIGGLWALYAAGLYAATQMNTALHILVHMHMFLAGYLFTATLVYVDAIPHRFSFTYRCVVCIAALAGHAILAKYIYAHPPAGVPGTQAKTGALLMYYGGDAVDGALVFVMFRQWYMSRRKGREALRTVSGT